MCLDGPQKQNLDKWMNDNFNLKSVEDVRQEIIGHWVYRNHLIKQGDSQAACRFALLETFVIQFRLNTAYSSKESLEQIMDNEKIKYKVGSVQ